MIRNKKSFSQVISLMEFELKLQWKKFLLVILIYLIIGISPNLFLYILNPNFSLPTNQESFFNGNLLVLFYAIPLASGLFFSGIVCAEYKEKTGLTLFPLMSKTKILFSKYITNYILLVISTTFYYGLTILFNLYFYAEWIIPSILLSYGFILFFLLAISGLICLLSSLLPSPVSVLLIELILFLFGFNLIGSFISGINYQFEPIFSLSYLFNIVLACLSSGYIESPRYYDIMQGSNVSRTWVYPEPFTSVLIFILYFIICFLLSLIIFKRREI